MGVVNGSNIDIAECGGWLKLRTLINNIAKPCPLPAFRDIERDLIVDADGLALAALLIAGPIGSASARITKLMLIAPFLLHRSTLHCYSVPWQTAT